MNIDHLFFRNIYLFTYFTYPSCYFPTVLVINLCDINPALPCLNLSFFLFIPQGPKYLTLNSKSNFSSLPQKKLLQWYPFPLLGLFSNSLFPVLAACSVLFPCSLPFQISGIIHMRYKPQAGEWGKWTEIPTHLIPTHLPPIKTRDEDRSTAVSLCVWSTALQRRQKTC